MKKRPIYNKTSDQERTAKVLKFMHKDIKYVLITLSNQESQGGVYSYKDICLDYYVDGLNYIKRFGMSITGEGQKEGVTRIDMAFQKIKKRVEVLFPNIILVFQYSTKFSKATTKNNSGCKVQVSIHLDKMNHITHRSSIKAHIPDCIKIIDEINKEIKNLFAE